MRTLQRLVDAAPEEKIVEAAVVAAAETPWLIILSKHEVRCETTLEHIKMLSQFANLFEYSVSESRNGEVVTLFHRFGQKGSLFWGSYLKTLFEQIRYHSQDEDQRPFGSILKFLSRKGALPLAGKNKITRESNEAAH